MKAKNAGFVFRKFQSSADVYGKEVLQFAKNAVAPLVVSADTTWFVFEDIYDHLPSPDDAYAVSVRRATKAMKSLGEDASQLNKYTGRVRSRMNRYYQEAVAIIEDAAILFGVGSVSLSDAFLAIPAPVATAIYADIWDTAKYIEENQPIGAVIAQFEDLLELANSVVDRAARSKKA